MNNYRAETVTDTFMKDNVEVTKIQKNTSTE